MTDNKSVMNIEVPQMGDVDLRNLRKLLPCYGLCFRVSSVARSARHVLPRRALSVSPVAAAAHVTMRTVALPLGRTVTALTVKKLFGSFAKLFQRSNRVPYFVVARLSFGEFRWLTLTKF
jgi:hypothetical protein